MTANAPFLPPVLEMLDAAVAAPQSPEHCLVEGINWRVAPGDFWVVGGLPGSGKSDLLATAAGLQRPLSGNCRLFGQELAGLSEEMLLVERLRIGLMFENGGRLFSQLTILQNIALPLRYHLNSSDEEIQQRVEAILKLTGLSDVAGRLPPQISRVLRQRAGLARALALQPEILLLDNPLAGLDQRQTRWWLDFLARLNAGHEFMNGQPVTLIVATEDLRPWFGTGRQFALVKKRSWVRAVAGQGADDEQLMRAWQDLVGDGEKN